MQLKDAASNFGRVGLLLPLLLIFLIAADSAYACPEHNGRVVYRTRAINRTSASYIPTRVISYTAPGSYRRCGPNLYDTRGARYMAAPSSGVRYVAIRSGTGYTTGTKYVSDVRNSFGRHRYGAVYDVDYGDARRYNSPRYVAIRHKYPIQKIDDGRYVEARSGYRRGNGVIRYINVVDDRPQYVAVRTYAPRTRYVAVRDDDDDDEVIEVRRRPVTRYVAIRNVDDDDDGRIVTVRNVSTGCARAVALRSCFDEIEASSTKHVVIRNVALDDDMDDDDDVYIGNKTKYIALDDDADDPEFIKLRHNSDVKYIEPDSAYYDDDGDSCVPVNNTALSTRTISYVRPAYIDDDETAILDGDGTTYVAANDIEDAYLSPVAATTSYDDLAEHTFDRGSNARYIVTGNAAPHSIPYVALDEDGVFNDVDPEFVAANGANMNFDTYSIVPVDNVERIETENVRYVPVEDVEEVEGVDTGTVSYLPVDHADKVEVMDAEAVSYVPGNDMDVETVRYVPVDAVYARPVSYVPVSDVNQVDADDDCSMYVSSVDPAAVDVADESAILVEEGDSDTIALADTNQIAGEFGYRDGFEDGREAALERDVYHPENSGDYRKATEGYEDEYGNKDVYKDEYRSSYISGYRAGFESGNNVA